MESIEALKAKGNACYQQKQYSTSVQLYEEAITSFLKLDKQIQTQHFDLLLQLYSNGSLSTFHLQQFDKSINMSSTALTFISNQPDFHPNAKSEATIDKLFYRRAKCYEQTGDLAKSFQDVKQLLHRNPQHKLSLALAKSLNAKLQQDSKGVQKNLLFLLDPVNHQSEPQKMQEVFLFMQVQSRENPQEMLQKQTIKHMLHLVQLFHASDSLTYLGFAIEVLAILASKAIDIADRIYREILTHESGANFFDIFSMTLNSSEGDKCKSKATVVLFSHVLRALFMEINSSQSEKSNSSLLMCINHATVLMEQFLMCFEAKQKLIEQGEDADGCNSSLVVAILDGLLKFVGFLSAMEVEAKKNFVSIVKKVFLFDRLIENTHVDSYSEDILNRIVLLFSQTLAQFQYESKEEKEKDSAKQEEEIKDLILTYCVSPLKEVYDERKELLIGSRCCFFLCSLFLVNREYALWAVEKSPSDFTHILHKLLNINNTHNKNTPFTSSSSYRGEEIAMDLIGHLCSIEAGRVLVSGSLLEDITKISYSNIDEKNENLIVLQSGAIAACLKISAVSKSFSGESTEGRLMIETFLTILGCLNLPKTKARTKKQAQDEKKLSNDSEITKHVVNKNVNALERLVEALSYVVTDTFVKEKVAHHHQALSNLLFLSDVRQYKYSLIYGIGYCLNHLMVSESQLKKEEMQNSEITPEQYEQLQAALKQKSVFDDKDHIQQINSRIVKIVKTQPNAIPFLNQLILGPSVKGREMAIQCFVNASQNESIRGLLVQQGSLGSLLSGLSLIEKDLKKRTKDESKMVEKGTQAIAKILISTNPNLVNSSQLFSCIEPLVEVCRKCESNLLQFESLMALTNIASVSEEAKNRILMKKGLNTIMYLQFSDNLLIRRAATETICNLLPCDEVIKHIFLVEDKLRLWLSLSATEEEDLETARAASGAIAMVSQVPQVASKIVEETKGVTIYKEIFCETEQLELIHRVLFTLTNVYDELEKAGKKNELKNDDKFMAKLKQVSESSTTPDVKEAALSLRKLLQC